MIAAQSGDLDAQYVMGIFCTERLTFDRGADDESIFPGFPPLATHAPADGSPHPAGGDDLVAAFADMTVGAARSPAEAEARSVHWFRRAAEGGHVASMHAMALRLNRGQGVAPDPREASDLYMRAAENGDRLAREMFAEQSLITREARTNADLFRQLAGMKRIPSSMKIPVHSPNLLGLMLAIGHERSRREEYRSLYYGKYCKELDDLVVEVRVFEEALGQFSFRLGVGGAGSKSGG
ncbi:hypothetical protein BDK51DRAFT_51827 [Blyttiomyces helicus]|uniref:HCP-like protein n=1 Tax=Blyttiomyces helicus TaxID=388810 RepID=A0A4P9WGV9_9FUNG|nr:hypothetical protein BDK51DRAFT_51827 [Blyttiomyces helicus]|eukprot:RKO91165.1 hypothetical protein BDK51DRAFT_51827 [Blyttiomyces helicus]